jgi:hypothetical protein
VVTTLDVGGIFWMSFFKGPLVGYDKLNDRHFVAYSAASFYNWAKSLVFDGQILWFNPYCAHGLMCFRPSDNRLGPVTVTPILGSCFAVMVIVAENTLPLAQVKL